MDFDEDKIDEFTLVLLYLVTHDRHDGFGARAWKGFDWDTLDRLHKLGYISNPVGRAKSVVMSEEGFLRAKELFERHFARKTIVTTLPKFTAEARKRWDQIPDKIVYLDNVWCGQCRAAASITFERGQCQDVLFCYMNSSGKTPIRYGCIKTRCGNILKFHQMISYSPREKTMSQEDIRWIQRFNNFSSFNEETGSR
jgi:hypothetical protein